MRCILRVFQIGVGSFFYYNVRPDPLQTALKQNRRKNNGLANRRNSRLARESCAMKNKTVWYLTRQTIIFIKDKRIKRISAPGAYNPGIHIIQGVGLPV